MFITEKIENKYGVTAWEEQNEVAFEGHPNRISSLADNLDSIGETYDIEDGILRIENDVLIEVGGLI